MTCQGECQPSSTPSVTVNELDISQALFHQESLEIQDINKLYLTYTPISTECVGLYTQRGILRQGTDISADDVDYICSGRLITLSDEVPTSWKFYGTYIRGDEITPGTLPSTPTLYKPVGAMSLYPSALDDPDGWQEANGLEVSRTTYSVLYDEISSLVGTLYGAGDGSTTFNFPNIPAPIANHKYIIKY